MSYQYIYQHTDYLDMDDNADLPNPRPRCEGCGAFVAMHSPSSNLVVHGPDIVRWTGTDCKRCGREVWGYEEVVGSVYPRFDYFEQFRDEVFEPIEDGITHADIEQQIKSSPAVAVCECGNDIRQAEIDLNMASELMCSSCVLAEVALIL